MLIIKINTQVIRGGLSINFYKVIGDVSKYTLMEFPHQNCCWKIITDLNVKGRSKKLVSAEEARRRVKLKLFLQDPSAFFLSRGCALHLSLLTFLHPAEDGVDSAALQTARVQRRYGGAGLRTQQRNLWRDTHRHGRACSFLRRSNKTVLAVLWGEGTSRVTLREQSKQISEFIYLYACMKNRFDQEGKD